MKLTIPSMMFLAALVIACGASVEVTREVVVTREVEVTRPAPSPVVERLEVPVTVEVAGPVQSPVVEIQEVPVTVLVDAERTVEVTRMVQVPVTVEVTAIHYIVETVEVPVTSVVSASVTSKPVELCNDYPHLLALLEAKRDFYKVKETFASNADYQQVWKEAASDAANQIDEVDDNRMLICGNASQAIGTSRHRVKSHEAIAMCTSTVSILRNVSLAQDHGDSESWLNVPLGEREGVAAFVFALRDHCYGGSDEIVNALFSRHPRIVELLD